MKLLKSIWVKSALFLFLFTLACGIIYPALITGAAGLFFSKQANGSIVVVDGEKVGSEWMGQQYQDPKHLWGRVMNIDVGTYKDEAGTPLMYAAPSNLSPASQEYGELVKQRVSMLQEANPNMDEAPIPVDLVTSSGSGLDPHISPAAAEYQVSRIAKATHMTESEVRKVIQKGTTKKFLGVFGEETVNVLKVNLMLDGILDK